MRIGFFEVVSCLICRAFATGEDKETEKLDERYNTSIISTTMENYMPAHEHTVSRNLSDNPKSISPDKFRKWAKEHHLFPLSERYTFLNPDRISGVPSTILHSLDRIADSPGKINMPNVYIPKPDYSYSGKFTSSEKRKRKNTAENKKEKTKKEEQNGEKNKKAESSAETSTKEKAESDGNGGENRGSQMKKRGEDSKTNAKFFPSDSFLIKSPEKDFHLEDSPLKSSI